MRFSYNRQLLSGIGLAFGIALMSAGATMSREYALLVALIAVVCIIAITFLGKSASSKFNTVGSSINSASVWPEAHQRLVAG